MGSSNEVYLTNTSDNLLARRIFVIALTLLSQERKCVLDNLVDTNCIEAYIVINETLVSEVYRKLQIESLSLSISKPLRGYDDKLFETLIIYFLLLDLKVNDHKKGLCPMLIAPLRYYSVILEKPWMNKHGVLLNMMRNKILFVLGRYEHDYNATSSLSSLLFVLDSTYTSTLKTILSLYPLSVSKRSLISIVEDETTREINSLQKDENIDISEVGAAAYYRLARDKNNKLFSLTIDGNNITPFTSGSSRDPRVPVNKLYPCESGRKYKKCCGSNISIYINKIEILIYKELLAKLLSKYYNYIDIFDRTKADELSPYRIYNYKLKFTENRNKIELSKSQIYSIFDYKLKQVKKYLDEYLKKDFIISSYALFASLVLFAEKSNKKLRFYIDYRKLNIITKRNRYSISLIDEVLTRIQEYKYITRLNIIAIFNKLRIHSNSENFTIFVISLEAYKYKVLSFGLTNNSATYQQYINNILFEYLNDFC